MLAFLLGLLGPIGDFVLKLINGMGPPQEVKEAEKAGAAEAQVQVMEAESAEVQKGSDAKSSAAASVADSNDLHKVESTDPNNRDNDNKA